MVKIRKVVEKDIPRLINIHLNSLPEDVMSVIGKRILDKYYSSILKDKSNYIFGIYYEKHLVSFCCIARSTINIIEIFDVFIISSFFKLFFSKPKIIFSAIIQFLNHHKLENSLEISFIATDVNFQSKGFGRMLINHINEYFGKMKIDYLITKTSNDRLKRFYIENYNAKTYRTFKIFDKKYYYLRWWI